MRKILRQYQGRLKIQVVSGHQQIADPVKGSPDTVAEPALPVAVGINHGQSAVFFCNLRKRGGFLQNVGGRIVEKHDVFPKSGRLRLGKGVL